MYKFYSLPVYGPASARTGLSGLKKAAIGFTAGFLLVLFAVSVGNRLEAKWMAQDAQISAFCLDTPNHAMCKFISSK